MTYREKNYYFYDRTAIWKHKNIRRNRHFVVIFKRISALHFKSWVENTHKLQLLFSATTHGGYPILQPLSPETSKRVIKLFSGPYNWTMKMIVLAIMRHLQTRCTLEFLLDDWSWFNPQSKFASSSTHNSIRWMPVSSPTCLAQFKNPRSKSQWEQWVAKYSLAPFGSADYCQREFKDIDILSHITSPK